ncbi:XRE family transcriptional regulator [Pseudomonas gingeri]|uniref:XRE family transcriptional regulator n=1 Tax=Pseudomonas gingeri TaxID=117681 RepID=UPI0015BD4D3C|nr:helix-turn-helix transcriptional regulator [Pseudomonas gingeri]NWD49049.1 helix-turn-helix transcriptional regulator [Pseudomonas gingeri]
MNFSERVKSRMEAKGLRATDISDMTGVSRATVSFWLSGTNGAKGKNLLALAKALDCSPDWLSDGTGSPDSHKQIPLGSIETWDDDTPLDEDEVYVPFLQEVELAAGSGRFAIEESDTSRLRFFKKDLRQNAVQFSNAKCVMVSGNSMLPVLRDGATVGINIGKNTLRDLVDGEMYAINHNGQLRVKQLYRTPTGIKLRSFNRDDHPDEEYTFDQIQDQQIAILGHVFWWAMYSRGTN